MPVVGNAENCLTLPIQLSDVTVQRMDIGSMF